MLARGVFFTSFLIVLLLFCWHNRICGRKIQYFIYHLVMVFSEDFFTTFLGVLSINLVELSWRHLKEFLWILIHPSFIGLQKSLHISTRLLDNGWYLLLIANISLNKKANKVYKILDFINFQILIIKVLILAYLINNIMIKIPLMLLGEIGKEDDLQICHHVLFYILSK